MNRRSGIVFAGIALIAGVMAFPLREIVNQLMLVPVAYLLWLLKLFYLSVDQALWWLGIVAVALLIVSHSLLSDFKPKGKMIELKREERGEVESLAHAIQRSGRGIYLKWLVANRLGRLAHRMLSLREHGKPRSAFSPLASEGWDPPSEVQQYLEKGLHGSFTDHPNTNWNYFSPPEKTSLDHDVKAVVEFLESKMENKFSG